MDDIVIRRAVLADTEAIGRLWEKLVRYHQRISPDLPRAAANGARVYARNMANRLSDSHTCVFVADHEGVIVGYVLGVVVDLAPEMFEQEAGGFLADIFVEEDYRRQGVGRALVMSLRDWFKQRQLKHFEWHVAYENQEGLAFWHAINGRELMVRMRADIQQDKDHD